jgi:hypothetical protein
LYTQIGIRVVRRKIEIRRHSDHWTQITDVETGEVLEGSIELIVRVYPSGHDKALEMDFPFPKRGFEVEGEVDWPEDEDNGVSQAG